MQYPISLYISLLFNNNASSHEIAWIYTTIDRVVRPNSAGKKQVFRRSSITQVLDTAQS
jgi:hypothetical protein